MLAPALSYKPLRRVTSVGVMARLGKLSLHQLRIIREVDRPMREVTHLAVWSEIHGGFSGGHGEAGCPACARSHIGSALPGVQQRYCAVYRVHSRLLNHACAVSKVCARVLSCPLVAYDRLPLAILERCSNVVLCDRVLRVHGHLTPCFSISSIIFALSTFSSLQWYIICSTVSGWPQWQRSVSDNLNLWSILFILPWPVSICEVW